MDASVGCPGEHFARPPSTTSSVSMFGPASSRLHAGTVLASGRRGAVDVVASRSLHGVGLTGGTYRLGPETGRLLVRTSRTGLGAKAGHDLTIEVTRWQGTAVVDPADPAACSVAVEAEVDSFEVRQGTGGLRALTDSDRTEIKKTIREKVLHTARHPTIAFRSTRIEGSANS